MTKNLTKIGLLLIAAVMIVSIAFAGAGSATDTWDGTIATAFDGGQGTEQDPYQIATGAQLAYLAQEVNKGTYPHHYYILTDDIDLDNRPWTPIANTSSVSFSGSIEGNDKTISNLKITATQDYVGLIGRIYADNTPLHFSNLTLKNVDISGTALIGSLIGSIDYASDVKIENCTVTGSVKISGTQYQIGGLIGCANSGQPSFKFFEIDNCTVSGDEGSYIRGEEQVGGIVGGSAHANSIDLNNCVSNIEIIGYAKLGGLIGQAFCEDAAVPNYPVTITGSSSYGNLHILNGTGDGIYTKVKDVKGFGTLVGCIAVEEISPAQLAISDSNSYGSIIGWENLSSAWTHEGSKPGLVGYYRATSDLNRTGCRDKIYDDNCIYYATSKDYAYLVKEGSQDKLYNGGKVVTDPVAKIGATEYLTLEDAVNASTSGDTITLLTDVDLTRYVKHSSLVPGYVFDFPDDVTLDLAGYNITSNNFGVVYQGNDLKIQNGGFIAANKGSYAIFIGDSRPTTGIVLDSIACEGGINICNANVTIQDSYSTSTEIAGTNYYAIWCDEDGHAVVKSGEFTSSSEQAGIVISCNTEEPEGSIRIEGGMFYAPAGVEVIAEDTENLITVAGGTFSDDTVKSHLLPGYLARESLLLEGYYEVVPGAEPTIDIEPARNESGATDISIKPTEHTNVTVDSENMTTTLTDNTTNVEITIQFSDMTQSQDTVSGNVSSIKATYPELQAITDEEETSNIPIALSLDLNESLTGTIVLPCIDTEYNSFAAECVENPVATVTGLENGGQTIEQINNNITRITLTFINVKDQFGANENPVIYHVDDEGDTTEITDKEWSGNNLTFSSDMKFSSYVLAKEIVSPYVPSPSSSHETGYTVLLSETVTPTPTPTATPGVPTIAPTTLPTQTQKSPAPFVGIIAGLGAAALFLRLRK